MCLIFFCLWKFMCWHSKSHSTHGPLWNTVDIYILVILERFFNTLHNTFTFFWGCVCDMLKTMVTLVQLVYHIFLQKKYSVEFIQCFNFFLYFDCVFVFCLFTIINVLTKCISQHPWTSLEYRGYLYICYCWGVPWYIAQHIHIFCGCVCNISKPMVTWVHLVYLVIFNLLFGEVCMCVIFMIWCLFGSVVSSKLWTWLISTKWPRPHLQEHELLRTSKKWFIWIIYKNKWTCIFCKKPSEIFYSAPLRNCSLPLWNTSRCMFDLTVVIEWKNTCIFFHGGWTSLFNCYYFNIINIRI